MAGAGPAGLTAAILLARAGRPVEIREAKATVGAKFFGGFQMLDDFSSAEPLRAFLARLHLRDDFLLRPALEAELYDSRLRRYPVRSREPFGWFVTRGPGEGTLDSSLLAQAREAGVKVVFGERVEGRAADVVATGPRAPDGIARELTFSTTIPDRVRVLFDARRAPGGYAYLFVFGGRATYGCALVRDLRSIDRHFDECLERFREIEDFPISEARTGASFMTFAVSEGPSPPGGLLAGEAGGFQDYLFGLGIRYAMETGALAARALWTGESFDALWRESVGRRRADSLAARYLYETFGDTGLAIFLRQAARRDFRTHLAAWSRPGPVKAVIAAFARALWRRRGGCPHELSSHWCRAREAR